MPTKSQTSPEANHKDTVLKIYDIVNRKLDNLDTVSIRIKAWAIALWTAIIAQVFPIAISRGGTVALVSMVIFVLWLIDMHYKLFHEQLLGISRDIEGMLQSPSVNDHQLKSVLIKNRLSAKLRDENGSLRREVKAALGKYWFHLPYVILLGGTGAVWILKR